MMALRRGIDGYGLRSPHIHRELRKSPQPSLTRAKGARTRRLGRGPALGDLTKGQLGFTETNRGTAHSTLRLRTPKRPLRETAGELDKRSPEAVERVLAERISIREAEIERLAEDREHGSRELEQVAQGVAVLRRHREQTEGFREMLAMEQPEPEDLDYQEYLEYMESRADRVAEVEVAYLGVVGVDSGHLLITDPCYMTTMVGRAVPGRPRLQGHGDGRDGVVGPGLRQLQ